MPSIYDNQQQKYLQQAQQAAQNALMQGAKKETAGFVPVNTTKPAQQTAPSQGTAAPAAQTAAGTYTGYSPSQAVLAAQQYLNQQLANKPGAYVSKYDAQLDSLLYEMMNRGPFTYDANADPLYNIYKDLYIQNGRRAMQDTLGNAAALAGGYGSSYGQSAAQQTYNQYMEGLNSVVPQLQQQAYQRYSDEGDRMAQNFQFMNALENQNYGRYRDTVSDWQMDRSYAYQAALNAEQMDRQQFQFDTNFKENQRQFDINEAFRQAQLAEDIRRYDQDFGENKRRYDQEFDYQKYIDSMNEAFRQKQFGEDQRRYDQDFLENQRRYDQDFLENQRRYDQDFLENQKRYWEEFAEDVRRYGLDFAEKQRQFDLGYGLDKDQFDFNVKKYEEAMAAQNGGGGGNGGDNNGGNDKNDKQDKQDKLPTESALDIQNAVKQFLDYVPTEEKYNNRKNKTMNYDEYIADKLISFVRDGRLTNVEALAVIDYYDKRNK